jgi:hypothetical protein
MRKCGDCEKSFTPRDKWNIGKYCSRSCARRGSIKIQIKKRQQFLLDETVDERKIRLKQRFEKYTIKNGDEYCWNWNGSKFKKGYGLMSFDGKIMQAHRVSFQLYNREIPKGLFVLHSCDVRECTNPRHLFLGTNIDNMKDMVKKGRSPVQLGSTNPNSVLKEDQVREIKNLLKKGFTISSIAREYKVSKDAIGHIKHGRSWSWLE